MTMAPRVLQAPGEQVVELPIHFAERREGDSKMNLRVQLESALIPFLLRRRAH
jgi:dolichol-phosphate mannosyltransferase